MFSIAILIGIYSYIIFAFGLTNLLYPRYIFFSTLLFIIFSILLLKKSLITVLQCVVVNTNKARNSGKIKLQYLLIFVLAIHIIINFIGALGPEIGFDALWYHLTIPKLYLENHQVFYIPGGLLYYSLMPKLTEMLYVGALALNGEILAKLTHFTFGLLSSIVLYKLSRNFFTTKISLIAVIVFYSNLVVAWQSTTAYIDLARTFFEIMALWGFVIFWKNGEKKWLIESAVMLGLAISTKLIAIGSLFIFSAIIVIRSFISEESRSLLRHHPRWFLTLKNLFIGLFVYWIICFLIPLPWFVFSFVNTGNPIYPFFTDIYKVGLSIELLNPFKFIGEVWDIFTVSPDPISPVYVIFLPLILILFRKFKSDIKLISFYSFLAIVVWYFSPRTGGGRFILPYLPFFSILVAAVTERIKDKNISKVLIGVVIIVSTITIIYRGAANAKYIPVIIGTESKNEFLKTHLNFSFGDFYDVDGYFKNNIKRDDIVLLYGFHNLYYVDFPFIDSSWVKKGDIFNYIATQDIPSADGLPKRFKDWELVYQNLQTHVKLYSKGAIKWAF